MNGALLINKHEGVSSFGMIELLQRQWMETSGCKKRDVPKMGHGGTLDPFATGLLLVLVGRAVKLARYFLGAHKVYEGVIRFGETTVPGDPTEAISETSLIIPESLCAIQAMAQKMTAQPYLQTPPMHSAKKKNGKPLYELARAGIEVERDAKLCHLYDLQFLDYSPPKSRFRVKCSSGTYIRTLTQDFARLFGSVALLENLNRTSSGVFGIEKAWSTERIFEASKSGKRWDELNCWIPFDELLGGYSRAQASPEERLCLSQGKQAVLLNILRSTASPDQKSTEEGDCVAIYSEKSLVAIARKEQGVWGIERVFN